MNHWLELRGTVWVMCDGIGCQPASDAEIEMWQELAKLRAECDAYRASSEIRGANLTDIQAVLKELSAYFAGTALDCRNMARKLRSLERASLDCSP